MPYTHEGYPSIIIELLVHGVGIKISGKLVAKLHLKDFRIKVFGFRNFLKPKIFDIGYRMFLEGIFHWVPHLGRRLS